MPDDHLRRRTVPFDLLELDGRRLTGLPLLERKAHLRGLLRGSPDRLRYVDHVQGNGSAVFARADALELEGIVSKRPHSRYQSGQRSSQWLKTKCWRILRFPVVLWKRRRRGVRERPC